MPATISQTNLGLTSQEEKIREVKYASPVLCKLDASKLGKEVKAAIIKISIITGWTYPDDKLYQSILEDQFKKKLLEEYPDLNFKEMEYAFRYYGTRVKDWGKSINLSLIDEVLSAYKNDRFEVSRKEEINAPKPEQIIVTEEQLINLHRQDIENFYQRCVNGRIPSTTPVYFKQRLVEDNLMGEKDNLVAFFVDRLNRGVKNIYEFINE